MLFRAQAVAPVIRTFVRQSYTCEARESALDYVSGHAPRPVQPYYDPTPSKEADA